jgi:chitin biosynthesis protein CHS5
VNISVTQNVTEEYKREREFWELQSDILEEFGQRTPNAPQIDVGAPFS